MISPTSLKSIKTGSNLSLYPCKPWMLHVLTVPAKRPDIFSNDTKTVVSSSPAYLYIKVKGKVIPLQAQRVGRDSALLFHDHGTRRGWVVSSTHWPHFIPRKDPVPILQENGWAPAPVWTGGKSRPHQDSIPDRPTHSQSLYRLSYSAHI